MKDSTMVHCSRKCRIYTSLGFLAAVAIAVGFYLFQRADPASAHEPLGKTWQADERVAVDRIDHSRFNRLLEKYVDSDGYVNYTAWRRNAGDRRELKSYLAELGRAEPGARASRSAGLAYWINAYNAVTLAGILQFYPTGSIKNHVSYIGGYNIWKHLPLKVGDKKYSLDDIEHKLLRKMDEPRIHFAIVCASVGCPRLLNEAYTAKRLEKQLSANSVDFFSRRKNLQIDARNRTLRLSAILKWFARDFGDSQAAVLRSIGPYLPKSARSLLRTGGVRVSYLDYNWNLNDAKSKPGWDRAH